MKIFFFMLEINFTELFIYEISSHTTFHSMCCSIHYEIFMFQDETDTISIN